LNRAPFERAVLVDRNGVVVDESSLRDGSGELRLYQLIDALFAQPAGPPWSPMPLPRQ
jgi:hypothetical protein